MGGRSNEGSPHRSWRTWVSSWLGRRRPGRILQASVTLASLWLSPMAGLGQQLNTNAITIRDPFIYPDPKTRTYYLYAQSGNRANSGYRGVEVYTSKDLITWSGPKPVLILPREADVRMVWAPEMHPYRNAYYLFASLTSRSRRADNKRSYHDNSVLPRERGTYVFRASSPLGPFTPISDAPATPRDQLAIDGTLFIQDGKPYLVFSSEWVDWIDGTIELVRLSDALTKPIGRRKVLFKGSVAPGSNPDPKAPKVTDGPYLYRSPRSGKLFMTWSTILPGVGYVVMLTESQSGRIEGPWVKQREIYRSDGGHGMIFKSFDGRLLFALHQPNYPHGRERLRLYNLVDKGDTLAITSQTTASP